MERKINSEFNVGERRIKVVHDKGNCHFVEIPIFDINIEMAKIKSLIRWYNRHPDEIMFYKQLKNK